jgi:synapsin
LPQVIGPDYPAVLKVSHAHAGMGKIKLDSGEEFRDIATVLSLHGDYCTGEPFFQGEYGIRVQKMGSSYRVYKKVATGSGWKSQFGGADLQVVEVTDTYKLWVDEAAKCFGGMDMLAIDAIHGVDGKDHIIELNGTAIGIKAQYWEEDSKTVSQLCIDKMNAIYAKQ